MVVEEIMTKNPVTIAPGASVGEAIERLVEMNIRHLPVVKDGVLVGIVSERDVRAIAFEVVQDLGDPANARLQFQAPVHEIMHTDVLTVEPGTDVGDLIDEMLDSRVGAMPVVDAHSQKLVGIVSYIDVIRAARPLFP